MNKTYNKSLYFFSDETIILKQKGVSSQNQWILFLGVKTKLSLKTEDKFIRKRKPLANVIKLVK